MDYCMVLLLYVLLPAVIALRSRQMGYSGLVWFVVAFFTNPFVVIALVGALPDRSLQKKRQRELKLLDAQLAAAGLQVDSGTAPVPRETISDQRTDR